MEISHLKRELNEFCVYSLSVRNVTAMWKWYITFVEFYFVSSYGTSMELNARDQLRLSRFIIDLEEMDKNITSQHERTFNFVDKLFGWDGHDINIYKT